MAVVERGTGSPVVLIPGIQGRWEWMRPTVDALAASHRVLTFSLGAVQSFSDWNDRIQEAADRAHEPATVIGVSFGGLVALRYAAKHPDRVRALVLVATPPPAWQLDRWSMRCVRHPWLGLPFFAVRGVARLAPELIMARSSWPARLRLAVEHGSRIVTSPVSPGRMAGYVRAWHQTDLLADCRRVTVPTLLVTGDRGVDRVVPVDRTLEYLELIPGARHVALPRTGHIGLVTHPQLFTQEVDRFLDTTPGARGRARPDERTRHAS